MSEEKKTQKNHSLAVTVFNRCGALLCANLNSSHSELFNKGHVESIPYLWSVLGFKNFKNQL